jgi:glycosyltransferase involved in cell wall biosynthesis
MRPKFDINHAHTPFMMGTQGLIRSKISKTPLVGTFHTMFMDPSAIKEYTPDNKTLQRFIIRYSWNYARLFYNSCNEVIAPSSVIKSLLTKNGIQNSDIVPNSVDLERFNSKVDGSSVRAKLGFRDKDRIVLYAGRVSREKRLETMIQAARRLVKEERVKFLVVGSGPAYNHYKAMVRKQGLGHKFTFTGFVAEQGPAGILRGGRRLLHTLQVRDPGDSAHRGDGLRKAGNRGRFPCPQGAYCEWEERRKVQAGRLLRLCTQNKEGYK